MKGCKSCSIDLWRRQGLVEVNSNCSILASMSGSSQCLMQLHGEVLALCWVEVKIISVFTE